MVSSATFSPDGTRVVTASEDSRARIWDIATGDELHVLEGHTNSVASAAFSPDGTRVVTASADHTARIWDSATGARLHVLEASWLRKTSHRLATPPNRQVPAPR